MFLTKGTFIKDTTKLKEGYKVNDRVIEAVVSAEKIEKVFENFLKKHQDKKVILFIELPLTDEQAQTLNLSPMNKYKDLYYLQGLTGGDAIKLMDMVKDILINDGNSAFGFLVPSTGIQLGKYRFNTMYLMANTPNGLDNMNTIFGAAGIPSRQNLTKPMDILSMDNPGICNQYKDKDGKTINDTVMGLISLGMIKTDTVIDEQYM